jgi:hypothetical protein
LFTGTGGILVVGAARDDMETGGTGPVDAGPPPVVPCGTGVDASGDAPGEPPCEPPPSHCVDENTLAFYTDGQCVDGTCKWTTQVLTCAMGCFGLGCRRNVTLPN